jgi:hypothetical protein
MEVRMSILDNLVDVVKFRIGIDSDDETSTISVRLALQLALSAFNMVPVVTYFSFEEDEENISQISDILVTYAAYVLLTKKAIEITREISVKDGGISYTPADSSSTAYLARELWNNWDSQVSNLKQSDSFYEDFIPE